MPNRQKFIGNAEALIELLNDMLNDAFSDEISEENESDFDVKTDLDYALDCTSNYAQNYTWLYVTLLLESSTVLRLSMHSWNESDTRHRGRLITSRQTCISKPHASH